MVLIWIRLLLILKVLVKNVEMLFGTFKANGAVVETVIATVKTDVVDDAIN